MRAVVLANELLAFVVEIAMLGFVAWWGFELEAPVGVRVVAAVVAVVAVAAMWGLLASPRARSRLPAAGVLAVKVVLFAVAGAGVWAVGYRVLAVGFVAVAVVNAVCSAAARARAGSG